MEEEEMLLHDSETENVETETTEEMQEGEELDTTETDTTEEKEVKEEEKQVKKTFQEILEENPEYQEEMNTIVKKRLNRARNSKDTEHGESLSELENLLSVSLGTSNLEESKTKLMDYLKEEGKAVPGKVTYSKNDLEKLANVDAQEIIDNGLDEIEYELKRMVEKGADNLTPREKLVFVQLDNAKKRIESVKELTSIGVKKEILENSSFKEFADKFAGSKFSMKDIYEMYKKQQPQKKAEPIGSMKNKNKGEVRTFITEEQFDKMTPAEVEKNLPLIQKSMPNW